MRPFLLDVNILIALLYARHEFNRRAESWFYAVGKSRWLTCPTTENGVIRILGGHRFPDRKPHHELAKRLHAFEGATNHQLVSDDISLLGNPLVSLESVGTSSRLTETYLLALAVRRDEVLATMDGRLSPSAVRDGGQHLLVIPD